MPPEPIRSMADVEVQFKSDPEPVAADEVEIYEHWRPRSEVQAVHREGP